MSNSVNSKSALRELFGAPGDLAVACMKDRMDHHHKRFIELSPFLCLATADEDGQPFVSPKGDAPGFVTVADDHTLFIPDRRGNNKVESFSNIVGNPKVSLIFFVPGLPETLRILGQAEVTTDEEIRALGKVGNSVPQAATKVAVTTVYFHCGKALVRSNFWSDEARVDRSAMPSFGTIIKEQAALDITVEETQDIIDDMYVNGLY